MDSRLLLELLSNANGTSGYEHTLQKIILPAFEPYADEVKIDKMGNIIALKKGKVKLVTSIIS